jgi:hypothetical protein
VLGAQAAQRLIGACRTLAGAPDVRALTASAVPA